MLVRIAEGLSRDGVAIEGLEGHCTPARLGTSKRPSVTESPPPFFSCISFDTALNRNGFRLECGLLSHRIISYLIG